MSDMLQLVVVPPLTQLKSHNSRSNQLQMRFTRAHARNLDHTRLNAKLEQITILKRVLILRHASLVFWSASNLFGATTLARSAEYS